MIARPTNPEVPARSRLWCDLVVVAGLAALLYGVAQVAAQWRQPLHIAVNIDLSVWALPKYAFLSLARGWIAYFFSLLFTILVGSWAYYDNRSRKYIIVALDILQSLPTLTFLAVFEVALIAMFPHSNAGLELACVFVIFTGQVWNMVFSYYDSLRGTPPDFRMLARLYNYNWWNRFWRLELPFGAQGLIYNSMLSMAGGWFFLTITEAFTLNNQDFRVPGIGSYMSVAIDRGDARAQIMGVIAMSVIIIATDRLVWWPLTVWSRKFKLDDFAGATVRKSGFQLWLARSKAVEALLAGWNRVKTWFLRPPTPPSAETSLAEPGAPPVPSRHVGRAFYLVCIAGVLILIAWGALSLARLISTVGASDWYEIGRDAVYSFARVLAAVIIGTIWTVPFGVWIGLNPKISGRLQPFIQFVASFPSPMIWPWLVALVLIVGGSLQWGAVVLILFGTQWYILFNVAGAAAAIPNDMISCASILHLRGWNRWKKFLIPAILPGLVTGWITAAGGAWNATILAEIQTYHNKTYTATGLGAYITDATAASDFHKLSAAALVMAVLVVGVNRLVWKRLQALANERCRFIV